MWRTRALVPIILAALLAWSGCTKPPTRDDPIHAKDDAGFQDWIDRRQEVLSAEDVRQLNEARQMIRYRTMQAHPGLPPDQFTNEVYAGIDGRTLRELLMTSYALQIDRVRVELENYQPLIERYRRYQVDRSLDEDERNDSTAKLKHVEQLVSDRRQELARLTKRLDELKGQAPGGK